MAEQVNSIEIKTEGTTRVLKIGDLTITIDQSKQEELEFPRGILFDFGELLAKLAVLSDQSNCATLRDALLILRSQLADQPELMGILQKLCATSVVIEPEFLIVPRELFNKMNKIVQYAAAHPAPGTTQELPRRRGLLGTDANG